MIKPMPQLDGAGLVACCSGWSFAGASQLVQMHVCACECMRAHVCVCSKCLYYVCEGGGLCGLAQMF